jgi:hypothetical protein
VSKGRRRGSPCLPRAADTIPLKHVSPHRPASSPIHTDATLVSTSGEIVGHSNAADTAVAPRTTSTRIIVRERVEAGMMRRREKMVGVREERVRVEAC